MLKRKQANCTLSLEERNHQIIKKLTQFKYLLRPKNTQVPEGMEG